jgi:type III restriction enzyme
MAKSSSPSQATSLSVAKTISDEVIGWRNQGYHPFPSETTRQLLAHWFDRDDDAGERFHECQRLAIETIVYLHEIRQIKSLRQLYDVFAPERLQLFKTVADEVNATPFLKYCIKSATGSGKTWVLAALVAWQYFNAVNGENNASYSSRFMVVTPGLEVRNRILDSFLGKRDPATGARNPDTADYHRPLFIPDSAEWRARFALPNNVLQPTDIRANTSPPDGPFIAITNWQQFAMAKDDLSLAEQIGLASPEEPQGEIIADFLTEYPDLIVLNDEAHHVHGKKTAKAEELVWRRFMDLLHRRMKDRHKNKSGLFLQFDFSATPFYGSGINREYFPHIVYDYDLKDALRDMLVKQLFLEERAQLPGQPKLEDLDFTADRDERRQVIDLSLGQKRTIDIGVAKLSELTGDLRNKGLKEKPVYMILCEDTTVANLVHDYLFTCKSPSGELFTPRELLLFHSELKKEKHGYTQEDARGGNVMSRNAAASQQHATLEGIDDNDDPLRVVISVLALREGFDKNNICVICALRAGEADILLEQIVGRGLRLMFPPYKTDETIQEAKRLAVEALRRRERPGFALDFLYIVEHPRFRDFYNNLRKEGYLIAAGDSSATAATGDLIPVEAQPQRIPLRDIAWPLTIQEEAKLPDVASIKVAELPPYKLSLDQVRYTLTSLSVTDRHLETDTRAETWALRDKNFNYDTFLAHCANIIAKQGKTRVLSAKLADIAALVDEYVSSRLFKQSVDFGDEFNYKVLADAQVQQFVCATIQRRILDLLGEIKYEVKGVWRRLSDLARINVREGSSIPAARCVYPRMPISSRFGGLERRVMETTLDGSPEVLAWCKLQRKHGLSIAYREPSGLLRNYEVDFILRTAESCFLLETKSDKDLELPNVGLKAKAAKHWCSSISGIVPPPGLAQPAAWEYLLLPEGLYRANEGASFSALLPMMRQQREALVAAEKGELFT